MVTGWKLMPAVVRAPRMASPVLALALFAGAAALVAALVRLFGG
jgi:hypothetical protein